MHIRLSLPFALGASIVAAAACLSASFVSSAEDNSVLRVCADPNNKPLSHQDGTGYENRIAQELARDLGRKLEYTYFPQRMGFVRNTLRKRDESGEYECDVIIGVPLGYELTATTQPYMRSTYALVFPSHDHLDALETADDLLKLPPEKLQALRIGVFARSPGADWLLRNHLFDRAVTYAAQSGDPNETPTSVIQRNLEAGNIDAAIVWGPIAGFLVREHADANWRAVPFKSDAQIKFDYEISMGVRFGEKEWKELLDQWIAGHRNRIEEILAEYRVPLLNENGSPIRTAHDCGRTGSDRLDRAC
jgi:quinoprotein dehydrogenase-associated probable ABC transporter substrate-binding protein